MNFKLGDRVRSLVATSYTIGNANDRVPAGATGTVTAISSIGPHHIDVDLDPAQHGITEWGFAEDEIELITG